MIDHDYRADRTNLAYSYTIIINVMDKYNYYNYWGQ